MMPLDKEIQELRYKVLDRAEIVQLQMNGCFSARREQNYLTAKEIILKEKKAIPYDAHIDKDCEKILALYQPGAQDLRFIFSAIRIQQSLLLLSDGLAMISKNILEVNQQTDTALLKDLHLEDMVDTVYEMYTGMISAFIQRSSQIAHGVYLRDDEVDHLKWEGNRLLIDAIKKNPQQVDSLLSLIFTLNRIEKLADHICAIVQEIVFFSEGRSIRRKHTD